MHSFLYEGHFHPDSPRRVRRHFIRGPFPFHFSPAYTPSFYTGTVSIQIPHRVYALILCAGHFHPYPPRIRRHFIRGPFPSRFSPAYMPSFYTGTISISIPHRVYAVILYGGRFHPASLPRIRHHFIRGPFPSRFPTGAISHPVSPPHICSIFISGTFSSRFLAQPFPHYYYLALPLSSYLGVSSFLSYQVRPQDTL